MATAQTVPAPAEFAEVRDFIEQEIERGETPGLSVAVVEDGALVWAEGFGFADLEKRIPATADTIYRVGSVSQVCTATGLMVLVDRDKVGLHRAVNEYLPGAKLRERRGSDEEPTVEDLARHRGSLPTHVNWFYDGEEPPRMEETIRRYGFVARGFADWSGEHDLGYGILGHVIEHVAGKPWREFMQDEVYGPLGMTRTSDCIRSGFEGDAAVQYQKTIAGRFAPLGRYRSDAPAGQDVHSTARDLARFVRMHMDDGELDGVRLLRPYTAQRMRNARVAFDEVGIGWHMEWSGYPVAPGHVVLQASPPGGSAMVFAHVEDRIGIVVLANSNTGAVGQVTWRLCELLEITDVGTAVGLGGGLGTGDESAPLGTWKGEWYLPDGDVSLRLDVAAAPEPTKVYVDEREIAAVVNTATRYDFSASFDGHTALPHASFHGSPQWWFQLRREGDALIGIAHASADGYFDLPHWVELRRVETEGAKGK